MDHLIFPNPLDSLDIPLLAVVKVDDLIMTTHAIRLPREVNIKVYYLSHLFS